VRNARDETILETSQALRIQFGARKFHASGLIAAAPSGCDDSSQKIDSSGKETLRVMNSPLYDISQLEKAPKISPLPAAVPAPAKEEERPSPTPTFTWLQGISH